MEKYENLTEIIAENLIYYRNKAHLTQKELSEKLNYSDKSVSKWERKEGVPDIHVLYQLAKLYGLTVNDFLTRKKKEKISNWYVSKSLVTLISVALVWFVTTIVFFLLQILIKDNSIYFKNYYVFIYAIPISAIVTTIYNNIYFSRLLNVFSVSVLCWTLALSIYLTLSWVENISLIFIIAIPFEVIIILFYLYLYKRKKR